MELLLLRLLVLEFLECTDNPEAQLFHLSVTRGMASLLVANKYEALDVGRSVRLTGRSSKLRGVFSALLIKFQKQEFRESYKTYWQTTANKEN